MTGRAGAADSETTARGFPPALPRTVWILALVALLMDTTLGAMFGSISLFLTIGIGVIRPLNFSTTALISGATLIVATLIAAASDRQQRRKVLFLVGCALSLATPVVFAASAGSLASGYLAMFNGFAFVLGRAIRDVVGAAWVSEAAPVERRGAAFGLWLAFSGSGLFVGLGVVGALARIVDPAFAKDVFLDPGPLLWLAIAPAVGAVLLLIFGVRNEKQSVAQVRGPRRRFPLRRATLSRLLYAFLLRLRRICSAMPRFERPYWLYLGVLIVVIVPLEGATVDWLMFPMDRHPNADDWSFYSKVQVFAWGIAAALAYPFGWWSDRLGRYRMLAWSMAPLAIAQVFFCAALVLARALTPSFGMTSAVIAAALVGLHWAMLQSALAALVADLAPSAWRGTAYGVFFMASAVGIFVWRFFYLLNPLRPGPVYHLVLALLAIAAFMLLLRLARRMDAVEDATRNALIT